MLKKKADTIKCLETRIDKIDKEIESTIKTIKDKVDMTKNKG